MFANLLYTVVVKVKHFQVIEEFKVLNVRAYVQKTESKRFQVDEFVRILLIGKSLLVIFFQLVPENL